MLRGPVRGRDLGGLFTFAIVLAILIYVSQGLLDVVSGVRIPVIGSTDTRREELIETLVDYTPTPDPEPVVPAPVASPDVPEPTNTPGPTPTPQQEIRRVGNTGGIGVYLRRTPDLDDRIRAWVDNSEMTLLGEEADAGGFHWIKVRDPAGNEGWIPEQYLLPAAPPAVTPAA